MLKIPQKYQSKIIFVTVCALWLFISQIVFIFIQIHYADKITTSLKNQFRSEFYSDNFQKLSNMVADLTRSNYIRCSKLVKTNEQITIIDFTTIQKNCNDEYSIFTLNNINKKIDIKSLSGINYTLSFQISNTNYFLGALWFLRLIGIILILLVYIIFKINNQRKSHELNKLQEITKAQEMISLKLAHDIRSPLSVLNLLSSKLKTDDPEINSLFLQTTERINKIANDLLMPKKNENLTDINNCLLGIINEKKLLFESENIHFISKLNINPIYSKIEISELQRIVSNIINNLAEALISSSKTDKIIQISTIKKENSLLISIWDNGCGISEENLKVIGSKRFSFGKETLNSSSGSGIGIFSAKNYLNKNNGKLEIKSKENEYTEIIITLQLAE